MTVKERLHQLVERLPEDELQTVEHLLEPFAKGPEAVGSDEPRVAPRASDLRPSDDPEELLRALDQTIQRLPKTTYLLTDEDISRESIYEGRP